MFGLNQGVTWNIFKHLDVYDAVSCSEVNKGVNRFVHTTDQLWEKFVSDLKIEDKTNPKEAIKNFFKISLGKDEAEIKKGWSDSQRKKIRKLPYIDGKKLAIEGQSHYINVSSLFNPVITTPVRTIDQNQKFVLCRLLSDNQIKVMTIYNNCRGNPNAYSDYYVKQNNGSITTNCVYYPEFFGKDENGLYPTLAQIIEKEIDESIIVDLEKKDDTNSEMGEMEMDKSEVTGQVTDFNASNRLLVQTIIVDLDKKDDTSSEGEVWCVPPLKKRRYE